MAKTVHIDWDMSGKALSDVFLSDEMGAEMQRAAEQEAHRREGMVEAHLCGDMPANGLLYPSSKKLQRTWVGTVRPANRAAASIVRNNPKILE